jgi:hypothetical protein
MTCQFCGSETASFSCAWPTMKYTNVEAKDLRNGDLVKLYGEEFLSIRNGDLVKLYGEEFLSSYVDGVSRSPMGCMVYLRITHCGRQQWREMLGSARVLALRPAPCGAPCCELCSREADETRHYGSCHWNAWSEVA